MARSFNVFIGRLTVAAVAATTALVGVGASPAAAIAYGTAEPASWAYIDAAAPNQVFVDGTDDAPVGSWLDAAGRLHTARSYFTYDISAYRGTDVLSAALGGREASVNDCSQRPPTELWRTKPATDRSSWNREPEDIKKIYTRVRPPTFSCPATYVEFDATIAVRDALAEGRSTLTLSLRAPSGALERDPAQGRHFENRPRLTIRWNRPPSPATDLETHGQPCATRTPYPWIGAGSVSVFATFTDADPDDDLRATFAMWPVDRPDSRVEQETPGSDEGRFGTQFAQSLFVHGETYAWQARVTDGAATSRWSKICYFRTDLVPPAAPAVSSTDYPDDGQYHGGVGIPGTFRFVPNGDDDVVRYEYSVADGNVHTVDADRQGQASADIAPTGFVTSMSVRAVDKGGNRSDLTYYQFYAISTEPTIEGELSAIGVPTPFTFRPGMPGVVAYRYQVNDEPAVTVESDAEGVAHADVTARTGGLIDLVVTSRTAAGIESSSHRFFYLFSAPIVSGEPYGETGVAGGPGVEGVFTFRPRMPDVVRYVYTTAWWEAPVTVGAGPDGTATVRWTPSTAGRYNWEVRSVSADGTESDPARYDFEVFNPLPTVTGSAPYPGQEGDFWLSSQVPGVVAFLYRFDDGPEQEVDGFGGYATILHTPVYGGPHTLTVRSRTDAGAVSEPTVLEFTTSSEPTVTSEQYPESTPSGFPGVEGTFRFTAPLPDVVEYRYEFEGEGFVVVPAAEDGSATITWTPERAGGRFLIVVAVTATGFESQARGYFVSVGSANPFVESSDYGWWVSGGIGMPGTFTFGSRRSDVVEYEYWLNDGPHTTVAAGGDGTASVEVTPIQGFQNVLRVRSHSTGGVVSDVSEYYFEVDTAPAVSSVTYPRNQEGGGVGVLGEFVFRSRLPGATEFVYRFGDGVEFERVPVGADGTATITHAPVWAGYNYVAVHTVTADSAMSHVESYTFYVPFS